MSLIGFVLNGVLLVLLAATIYFAVKLSLLLGAFRNSRGELASLISELSRTIDQAQIAIAGLRESAREGGRELQEKIDQAQALGDELDVMASSGEKLARRLESVMARAREESASGAAALFRGAAPRRGSEEEAVGSGGSAASGSPPAPGGFAIRDREMDAGGAPSSAFAAAPARPALFPGDDPDSAEDDAIPEGLYSKAERELYAALKKGTKGRGAA